MVYLNTQENLTISLLSLTAAIFSPPFSLLYDLASFFLLSDVSHENFQRNSLDNVYMIN